MSEENKTAFHEADSNGDGRVSKAEHEMYMEFKRKRLEDEVDLTAVADGDVCLACEG